MTRHIKQTRRCSAGLIASLPRFAPENSATNTACIRRCFANLCIILKASPSTQKEFQAVQDIGRFFTRFDSLRLLKTKHPQRTTAWCSTQSSPNSSAMYSILTLVIPIISIQHDLRSVRSLNRGCSRCAVRIGRRERGLQVVFILTQEHARNRTFGSYVTKTVKRHLTTTAASG